MIIIHGNPMIERSHLSIIREVERQGSLTAAAESLCDQVVILAGGWLTRDLSAALYPFIAHAGTSTSL